MSNQKQSIIIDPKTGKIPTPGSVFNVGSGTHYIAGASIPQKQHPLSPSSNKLLNYTQKQKITIQPIHKQSTSPSLGYARPVAMPGVTDTLLDQAIDNIMGKTQDRNYDGDTTH